MECLAEAWRGLRRPRKKGREHSTTRSLSGLSKAPARRAGEAHQAPKQGVVAGMIPAGFADGRIQREIRVLDRIGRFRDGQPDFPQTGCGHGHEQRFDCGLAALSSARMPAAIRRAPGRSGGISSARRPRAGRLPSPLRSLHPDIGCLSSSTNPGVRPDTRRAAHHRAAKRHPAARRRKDRYPLPPPTAGPDRWCRVPR